MLRARWRKRAMQGLTEDRISQRQLLALGFVSILSPAIRLLPEYVAGVAGRGAWIVPIGAAVPVVLLALFSHWALKNRRDGEGMTEMLIRSIGKGAGRIVAILIALWAIVYAGFILRVSAERLIAAAYPKGHILFFLVPTLIVSFIAAMGKVKSLGRTAEAYVIVISFLLVAILVFAAADIKIENLIPLTARDVLPMGEGVLAVVDVVAVYGYFTFLYGHVKKETGEKRKLLVWTGATLLVLFGIMVTTVGTLSAWLVTKMENPFFAMVKNVSFFGIVERIEAVLLGVWVVTDFIYLASLLSVVFEIFSCAVPGVKRMAVSVPAAVGVLAVSLIMAGSTYEIDFFSRRLIPGVNLGIMLIVLPAALLIGKIRRKI